MKTKIRAGMRTLAIVGMVLLLAGCFRVNMDLEVSPENTVDGSAIIAVNEELLELSGQSVDQLFQDMDLSTLPEGTTVDPYQEDGFVGQEISFTEVPLSEFSGSQALGGTGEELSITRQGDEFHVDGSLDMSGGEFDTGQVPPEFLESFEFTISITFPGEVEEATGEVSGNTVTWEPQIGEANRIHAIASAIPSGSPWLLIVLVAVGALILGAIAFMVLGRRRPATAAGPIEETPMTSPDAAAYPSPAATTTS
jgi:hypothetical protein